MAKEAGRNLVEQTTRETYSSFRAQMEGLMARLRHLNAMLMHEDEMALDELADAPDRAFELPAPEYRHVSAHGKMRFPTVTAQGWHKAGQSPLCAVILPYG